MYRKQQILLMIGLVSFAAFGSGCVGPKQEVVTFWNKLGIPQTSIFLRDHFTNRKGNNPQCERKPPLLRIADAANLESPSLAVQAAAKVKQAEDLAPQKIKALKYLATAGCGCYDEDGKIKDALLQALADCTPAVRLAAIQAIEATLGNCDDVVTDCSSCGGRGCPRCMSEKRAQRLQDKELAKLSKTKKPSRICHRCSGKGCVNCGGCGECSSCGGCNSMGCCSKEVQAKLKDMAFGTDKSGCFKEPVAAIRSAAERLLTLCPPVEPDQQQQQNQGGQGEQLQNQPAPAPQPEAAGDGAAIRIVTPAEAMHSVNYRSEAQPQTSRREAINASNAMSETAEDMIVASVEALDRTTSQISLMFSNDLMIPTGEWLVVQTSRGSARCQVIHSTPGRLYAQIVDNSFSAAPMSGELIKFGVLAQ